MATTSGDSKDYPNKIVVPSDRTPTVFNEDALSGAIIGNVLGGNDHALLGTVAGGAVGGMIGKQQMEHEYSKGRTVSKPASAGRSILMGVVAGGLTIGLLGFLAADILALPVILAATGVAAAVGGLIGYVANKSAAADYDTAKAYYNEHGGQYQGRERETQKEQMQGYKVTPEEYALLQKRLAEKPSRVQALEAQQAGLHTHTR